MVDFLQRTWQLLLSHWHEITFVVSLSSLFLWLYRTFATNKTQQKNHDVLSNWIAWAARAGWLDLLQSAVRWALDAIAVIYGPINKSAAGWTSRYLTRRAWRMSAWISSLYLLVLIPFGLVAAVAAELIRGFVPIDANTLGGLTLLALVACGLLAVHVRLLKAVRREQPTVSFPNSIHQFFVETAIGFAILALILGYLAFVFSGGKNSEPNTALAVVGFAAIPVFLGLSVVRAIVRFGFFAPIALTLQLTLGIAMAFQLLVGALILTDVLGLTRFKYEINWQGLLTVTIACVSLICFATMAIMRREAKWPSFLLLIIALAASAAEVFVFGTLPQTHFPDALLGPLLSFAFALKLCPYLLVIYGVVFANAFPDWISVALTRFILSRASQAKSILEFLIWLVVDLMSAAFCLVLSNIILASAMGLSYLLDYLTGTAFLTKAFSGDLHGRIQFFANGTGLFQIAYVFFLQGSNAAWVKAASLWTQSSDFKIVLLTSLIGCAALIPTFLNAIALGAFVFARVMATLFGRPLRWLHGRFLLREDATIKEIGMTYDRSGRLLSMLAAIFVALIIWIIKLLIWGGR
jgi:hypothetical protein